MVSCSKPDKAEDNPGKSEAAAPLMALCSTIYYADTAALHDVDVMARHIAGIVKLMPVTDSLTIRQALIHDLPAMPTLYLLDSDRRVILKDPDVTTIL